METLKIFLLMVVADMTSFVLLALLSKVGKK